MRAADILSLQDEEYQRSLTEDIQREEEEVAARAAEEAAARDAEEAAEREREDARLHLSVEDLRAHRLRIFEAAQPTTTAPVCTCLTRAGRACKLRAAPGGSLCHVHLRAKRPRG
tara:strand:- start:231 stop:575 length:345 start_codon:yes stop_codon:yes gene_type:complete